MPLVLHRRRQVEWVSALKDLPGDGWLKVLRPWVLLPTQHQFILTLCDEFENFVLSISPAISPRELYFPWPAPHRPIDLPRPLR